MKWTQEQRDKACIFVFTAAGMPKSAKHLSDAAIEVAIEIACQRNALLEALKGCRQRWLDAARNPAFWDAGELRDLADIDAAIAKAEGK